MSDYRMQIINGKTGRIVQWRPGDKIETDVVEDLCERLRKRGVGWFKSEAKVLDAVRGEFANLLYELKRKV